MKNSFYVCVTIGLAIYVGGLVNPFPARFQAADYVPFAGERSTWHEGFNRFDYLLDEKSLEIKPFQRSEDEKFGVKDPPTGKRRCIVVVPKKPAKDNPWSWQGCYWNHEPQAEVELLRRGYHIVYISANSTLKPDKTWEAWYDYLTQQHGLSTKPAFVGMSRGGEYAYIWSTLHPDKVSCIYADNTGMNADVLAKLGDLAKADVPLLHVNGSIDPLLGRCSNTVENIYRQLGGRISVIIKEGMGHHPHSLRDPKPIADFISQSFPPANRVKPDFLPERVTRTSFYSVTSAYEESPKEGTYLTFRGPQFTDCYDRYSFDLSGIEGPIQVIVPKTPARGMPWVFRADLVNGDAAVDLALLSQGFTIVTGPVPYNADGPSLQQWNKVYESLTSKGFSKKPVLAGAGGAAGEAYAWAIANSDKVACIYAENPMLRCTLTKSQPLDNFQILAKAHVSILHVCGSRDPHLQSQTRIAEAKYRDLGGELTVILSDGAGHYPNSPRDVPAAVQFIVKNTINKNTLP
jgi:pimeloyl-ACP methyl ester carboxylesterase